MSLSSSLKSKETTVTIGELEELTGCKILLNGNRPEVALRTDLEIQMFKRFLQSALANYSLHIQERVLTHVWDRFCNAMEYRAFARYFLEGWLSAHKVTFAGLTAYSSFGLPKEIIKPFLTSSNGQARAVADFGFGQVSTLNPWTRLGIAVSAFDMNPFCVEAAQKNGFFSRVVRIDGEYCTVEDAFNISPESQDIVTTTLTLDRVAKPKQLLDNMLACLRSGGHILVHTLLPVIAYDDGPNLDSRIEYTKPDDRITSGQAEESDRKELMNALNSLGVRNIRCQPFSYSIASLDGSQTYVVCQLSGIKI